MKALNDTKTGDLDSLKDVGLRTSYVGI